MSRVDDILSRLESLEAIAMELDKRLTWFVMSEGCEDCDGMSPGDVIYCELCTLNNKARSDLAAWSKDGEICPASGAQVDVHEVYIPGQECGQCGGSGRYGFPEDGCPRCHGTGRVKP